MIYQMGARVRWDQICSTGTDGRMYYCISLNYTPTLEGRARDNAMQQYCSEAARPLDQSKELKSFSPICRVSLKVRRSHLLQLHFHKLHSTSAKLIVISVYSAV